MMQSIIISRHRLQAIGNRPELSGLWLMAYGLWQEVTQ